MTRKELIKVGKDDLLAAWTVLENLAVSFDQLGATFGGGKGLSLSPEQQRALQEALAAYFTPALVRAINEARVRLGQYISDVEAEALLEQIAYWDYESIESARSNTS